MYAADGGCDPNAQRSQVEVLPDPGTVAEPLGWLVVLAAPSCFGFLLFVCLLIGGVAWHDLAI